MRPPVVTVIYSPWLDGSNKSSGACRDQLGSKLQAGRTAAGHPWVQLRILKEARYETNRFVAGMYKTINLLVVLLAVFSLMLWGSPSYAQYSDYSVGGSDTFQASWLIGRHLANADKVGDIGLKEKEEMTKFRLRKPTAE